LRLSARAIGHLMEINVRLRERHRGEVFGPKVTHPSTLRTAARQPRRFRSKAEEEPRRQLRSAIRAARKERLETLRLWISTIVPSLTGLLGVIVALLAIVLGRR
jgi:hypothetical protein